jgi:hypothetical protein
MILEKGYRGEKNIGNNIPASSPRKQITTNKFHIILLARWTGVPLSNADHSRQLQVLHELFAILD